MLFMSGAPVSVSSVSSRVLQSTEGLLEVRLYGTETYGVTGWPFASQR